MAAPILARRVLFMDLGNEWADLPMVPLWGFSTFSKASFPATSPHRSMQSPYARRWVLSVWGSGSHLQHQCPMITAWDWVDTAVDDVQPTGYERMVDGDPRETQTAEARPREGQA